MMEGVVRFPAEFAGRYREKGYWRDEPLRSVFNACCQQFADRTAIADRQQSVTFWELEERSTNLALNLLALGLKPGDRVVVQLPNEIQFAYLHFAMQKIGVMPVFALPPHRFREIGFFVKISEAVATITSSTHREFSYLDMVDQIRAEAPHLKHAIVLGEAPEGFVSLDALIDTPASLPASLIDDIQIDPEDPALFLLSGGTTGIPKLIPRTHNDYAYNSRMASSVCAIDQDSVLLNVLPIGHNLPLGCPGLQGFLMAGAKTVFHTSTAPEEVFPLIERHKVTHIHAVPALLIKWIESTPTSEYDLSSVKVIQSGGQRMQPEVRRRTAKVFPNCTVQENFGMAEGLLMFVRLDDPLEVRMETVGRNICPDDEIMLLGDDDKPVKPGEVGELCCRGPYTLRGYYKAEEHNARAFTPDGYYRSGDLMRQHPSGNYMVEGRKKDLINRGAEKISAEEIEELILRHAAVANVACVPVPDPKMGESNCACIVLRNGCDLSLNDLRGHLDQFKLAKFKYPERLEPFDSFPLSDFGKVSKKDLVAIVVERIRQSA